MALFGSLNALPLEELLQLLAHKEGAVEIWNVKDIPATTLYLKPGYIRSIDQHGKPLEALAAKATLQALLQAREGSFEFLPGAKPKHKVRLNWPVEKVLLSTVTLQDELERYRPYFPHPKAIFKGQEAPPGGKLSGQVASLPGKGGVRRRPLQGPQPAPGPGSVSPLPPGAERAGATHRANGEQPPRASGPATQRGEAMKHPQFPHAKGCCW